MIKVNNKDIFIVNLWNMIKVNNKDTFIVNFEHISYLVLVFLLLTLNM